MKHLVCILIVALYSRSLLADYPVEILQLQGHPAEEIIPLIKPFIEKDGSVAGMNDRLVIRTSPENMKQIKKIVASLDKPPRRLMIYVRQGPGDLLSNRTPVTGADSDSGHIVGLPSDRGVVQPGMIVGLPPDGVTTASSGFHAGTRSGRDQTQRIQAIEGKPAYIEIGTQVPVYEGAIGRGPLAYGAAINTRYKNATTGFYALARTNGNQVTVEINSQQIQQGSTNDRFDAQRSSTTISGNIGEWMPLGGASRDGFGDQKQGGINVATSSNQDRSMYLKVEALD